MVLHNFVYKRMRQYAEWALILECSTYWCCEHTACEANASNATSTNNRAAEQAAEGRGALKMAPA